MNTVIYIVIAILIFAVLIVTHELGHFLAAKLFHVRVSQFAVGMGPALLKKQKGETLYALRAFPIGGFCAMEEDEESEDPRAFTNQSWWKRFIILAAGALMNFITGIIILLFIVKKPRKTRLFQGFGFLLKIEFIPQLLFRLLIFLCSVRTHRKRCDKCAKLRNWGRWP